MNLHDAPLASLLHVAANISRDTCGRLAREQAEIMPRRPHGRWVGLDARGADPRFAVAAQELARLAGSARRPYVRRAVGRFLEAVRAVAAWRPRYRVVRLRVDVRMLGKPFMAKNWSIRPESVAHLEQLRNVAKLRWIELEEMHADHPDMLSRLISVARRSAVLVLGKDDGRWVAEWFSEFAEADAA